MTFKVDIFGTNRSYNNYQQYPEQKILFDQVDFNFDSFPDIGHIKDQFFIHYKVDISKYGPKNIEIYKLGLGDEEPVRIKIELLKEESLLFKQLKRDFDINKILE